MIPFFDVGAVNEPYRAELDVAWQTVRSSGQYILGPQVAAFEEEFAAFCGVRHCVGVGSGLDALSLIIGGYGFGPGDEIIVPANTYIASVLAISANGCTPVLVEPDPSTFNLDPKAVEAHITPATRAILAVHLYGRLCDWDALTAIADHHGLTLIEDAAQAHGAVTAGRRAGALGDAAGFSFYPTKNLGCLGDGGAVTTNDDELAQRVRMLRNHGSAHKSVHEMVGTNSRLDELQAAMLRVKLPHLEADNQLRRDVAAFYLDNVHNPKITLPNVPESSHVVHLFVVRAGERDDLHRTLARAGVGAAIHYPTPPHRQGAYRGLAKTPLPITEQLSAQVLSLPAHPALTRSDLERVVEVLNAW